MDAPVGDLADGVDAAAVGVEDRVRRVGDTGHLAEPDDPAVGGIDPDDVEAGPVGVGVGADDGGERGVQWEPRSDGDWMGRSGIVDLMVAVARPVETRGAAGDQDGRWSAGDGGGGRLGDPLVLIGGGAGDPDRPGDLSIDDHGGTAAHR